MSYTEFDRLVPEVIKHIGVLGQRGKNYQIELNLVKWGNNLRYDIRRWDLDHNNCGKGIALTSEEYQKLIQILIVENNKEENSEDARSALPPDLF